MTHFCSALSSLTAITALSACGGSSTSAITDPPVSVALAALPDFAGAADGTPSNGLPFAQAGDTRESFNTLLADTTQEVGFVSIQSAENSDDITTFNGTQMVTFAPTLAERNNPNKNNDRTLTVLGETVVITDQQGQLSDGSNVSSASTYYTEASDVIYVVTFPRAPDSVRSYSYFMVGQQTDPATLSGSVTYDGQFATEGFLSNLDGTIRFPQAEQYGDFEIAVDLDTQTVAGTGTIDFGDLDGLEDVVLNLDGASLNGNAITSALSLDTATCPAGTTCSGGGDFAATFMGAEPRLAGLVTLDVMMDGPTDDTSGRYQGVGGFVLYEQ